VHDAIEQIHACAKVLAFVCEVVGAAGGQRSHLS
jgi:hypothetical protein